MNTKLRHGTGALLLLTALAIVTLAPRLGVRTPIQRPTSSQLAYMQLPLTFEPNVGQSDAQVRYLAHGSGYTIFLTGAETVLSLQDRQNEKAVLRLQLNGANPAAKIEPLDEL